MAAYVFHVYRGEGLSSSINLSSGQTVHLKALRSRRIKAA